MTRKMFLAMILLGVLVLTSASAVALPARCPNCGGMDFEEQTTRVTDSYRTACTHMPNGYDRNYITHEVHSTICIECGTKINETWTYIGTSVTCHGF